MKKQYNELDVNKVKEFISSCKCCRIGLNDNGQVYIVPLSFGFSEENGKYTFYFHSSQMGRKIDIINKNPQVGFELDIESGPITSDIACKYSVKFQSIIGNGTVSFIEDIQSKKDALNKIMEHNTNKGDWDFNSNMLDKVCIFQLSVDKLTLRENS